MKISALIIILFQISAIAQDWEHAGGTYGGPSIGNFIGTSGFYGQGRSETESQTKARLLNGHIYRKSAGVIHNFASEGHLVFGNAAFKIGNVLVLKWNEEYFAITNYAGHATLPKSIESCVIPCGTFSWMSTMSGQSKEIRRLRMFDCGQIIPAVEEAEAAIESQQSQAAQARESTESRMLAEDAKIKAAQTNAFIWLQSQATNGSVSAQFDLGEHYWNGLGCATNRELAMTWFKSAAAGGSLEASNRLVELKIP